MPILIKAHAECPQCKMTNHTGIIIPDSGELPDAAICLALGKLISGLTCSHEEYRASFEGPDCPALHRIASIYNQAVQATTSN